MSDQVITSTDCRSPVGVTVGLIDGIIAMARVLKTMDQSSPEVQEALRDLRSDEDFLALMAVPVESPMVEKAYEEWKKWLDKNGWQFEKTMQMLMFGKGGIKGNPFIGSSDEECKLIIEAMNKHSSK